MLVRYYGPFAKRTGYGQAANDYCAALYSSGVELDIRLLHESDTDRELDERYHGLLHRVNYEDFEPTHVIAHAIPMFVHTFVTDDLEPKRGVKKIAITTWETTRIPSYIKDSLTKHFDSIWVPSQFCANALVDSGVPERQVEVIPHTFDPAWWGTSAPAGDAASPYTFYTILTWCERKNPIGLLKAYLTRFTSKDNVVLKICTPSYNRDDLLSLLAAIAIPEEELPRVEFIGLAPNRLNQEELRQLHATSHCYVTAARAEGWGLGSFEAAAFGNFVIAPAFSGHREYLDQYNFKGYVNSFLTPAIVPESVSSNRIDLGGGLTVRPVLRTTHDGIAADQDWGEPDLHGLQDAMQTAARYRWGVEKDGAERHAMLNRYSYEQIGALMVQKLETL